MPKIKAHSGTKDRIRVTKNGKVMVRHASSNHKLQKKSAARKRLIAGMQELTGSVKQKTKKRLGV